MTRAGAVCSCPGIIGRGRPGEPGARETAAGPVTPGGPGPGRCQHRAGFWQPPPRGTPPQGEPCLPWSGEMWPAQPL